MKWEGNVARMREATSSHRVLVGNPEKKRPLRMPSRRWEDDIKMHFTEMGLRV
jgi:hypothetical protein